MIDLIRRMLLQACPTCLHMLPCLRMYTFFHLFSSLVFLFFWFVCFSFVSVFVFEFGCFSIRESNRETSNIGAVTRSLPCSSFIVFNSILLVLPFLIIFANQHRTHRLVSFIFAITTSFLSYSHQGVFLF